MERTDFKKGLRLVSVMNGNHYIVERVARNKNRITVRWITGEARLGFGRLYQVPMYRAVMIFEKDLEINDETNKEE